MVGLFAPYAIDCPGVGVTVIAAVPAVTVIVLVPAAMKFAASLGVKVAVMRDVPLPTTVAVFPFIVTTDVLPELYVNVPGVLGDGDVMVNVSP
jgi:hypothetical protein